jgi:hypothetical protein
VPFASFLLNSQSLLSEKLSSNLNDSTFKKTLYKVPLCVFPGTLNHFIPRSPTLKFSSIQTIYFGVTPASNIFPIKIIPAGPAPITPHFLYVSAFYIF